MPVQQISNRSDMLRFVDECVERIGGGYSPETSGDDYSDPKTGEGILTEEEIFRWEKLHQQADSLGFGDDMAARALWQISRLGLDQPERTKRSYDNPNLSWRDQQTGTVHKIFALTENEYIEAHTSTNYDHTYKGPAIVVEMVSRQMRTIDHKWVNDANFWLWIGRLLRQGLPAFSQTLLVPTEEALTGPRFAEAVVQEKKDD